jgi:hypothetical protein
MDIEICNTIITYCTHTHKKKRELFVVVWQRGGEVNDGRYSQCHPRKKKKKAVLITGNDAIASDNNKNEASGEGISAGPPEHVICSAANEWTSIII